MPALEDSDTAKDHVSHPQGHCLASSVIILLVVLCFLLLKKISLPLAHLMLSLSFRMYFLDVGVAIDFRVIKRVTSVGS